MTSKEFKDEYIRYYYSNKLFNSIKEDIDNLYYELTGVKGYDYSKIPTSFNASISEQKRLDIIEFINIKKAELEALKSSCEHMSLLLPKFTKQEINILNRVLIYKESYESIGYEFGYSASSMWRYVESFIDNVIKS